MRVPQVTERMKEAPAHALRAVFAGIGQVLLVADRIKNRATDGDAAPPAAAPESPAAASATATPGPASATATPGPAASPAAPATASAAAAPQAAAAKAAAASPAVPAGPAAGDLPLPGYDELSIPSLRARMRSLNPAQLRALVDYERAHDGRDAVLAMFERRIAKVEGGEA